MHLLLELWNESSGIQILDDLGYGSVMGLSNVSAKYKPFMGVS